MLIEDEDYEDLLSTPGWAEMARESEARGEARGEARAREELITDLLGRIFARRVGRRPSEAEARSIVERSLTTSAVEVEDALLDLDRDALLRWLAEPTKRD